jgi:hypothetical protein
LPELLVFILIIVTLFNVNDFRYINQQSKDIMKSNRGGIREGAGRSSLQATVSLAVEVINSILKDGESDVVRLNAAKEVLNRAGLMTAQVIGSDDAVQLKKDRDFNETLSFY